MNDLWIFGYGSLIFKADFPFLERTPATLPAWTRRFWQGSADHRGTPAFTGRVVTIVKAPGYDCWGMAYRIAETDITAVLDHLDYREKGGYQQLNTNLHFQDGSTKPGLTYLADEHNSDFLGHAPVSHMAQQILKAVGPSGTNIDYLLQLEASLIEHEQNDEHVFELADAVRALQAE